ncbi:11140_t:CDS:1, partial [Gigaspora margarita]
LLTLDALSALNVARRDEALKSFMPSHQPTPETESVFGGELQEIMKKGNREAKFFNDALYQRRWQENLERKPTRPYYSNNVRGTRYNRFQTPRYRNFSSYRQGNGYRGGPQTDRPNQQQTH